MSGEAKSIGRPAAGRRYQRLGTDQAATEIDVVDVLRAQAQELLESGDVRLLMDRAFRWGYTDDHGQERLGLQQVLEDLRQRRDDLIRQKSEAEASAQRNAGEFDSELKSGTELQDELSRDDLRSSESSSSGATPTGPRKGTSAGQNRGEKGRWGEHAASDSDAAPSLLSEDDRALQDGLRYRQPDSMTRLLEEFQRIERALHDLSHLGSVTSLPEIDLQHIVEALSPEDGDWLLSWQRGVRSARSTSTGKGANARFELPPKVATAIGADILKSMFRKVTVATGGDHATWQRGNAGDAATETSDWEPGEALDLDLVSTVFSAVKRNPHGRRDGRVPIDVEDFQVVRRTTSTAVSSVLALDRSRSMGQGGGWLSAKRIALALHELISRSYPRDSLDLVAFSSTAELIPVKDLPLMSWDRFEHGTNLQGALALARSALRKRRGGTRQIILVTDGEPTLASGPSGSVFASPPDQEVMKATLREVDRCTRERIVINLILLTDSDAMRRFGDQVARINNGRVFHASTADFGASLLKDYVSR